MNCRIYSWKKVKDIMSDLVTTYQMLSISGQKWRHFRVAQEPETAES